MQLFYFSDLVVTPSCSMLAVNTPLHFASYYGHPLEVNWASSGSRCQSWPTE